MLLIKKGDTSKPVYIFVQTATHVDKDWGATPLIYVVKNGSISSGSGTVEIVNDGVIKYTPTAGDVDTVGPIAFVHLESVFAWTHCMVVDYDPYTNEAKDILEGDWSIDKTVTPWQIVCKKKGTETELVRKDLKDVNGGNITSITQIIGQQVEPE